MNDLRIPSTTAMWIWAHFIGLSARDVGGTYGISEPKEVSEVMGGFPRTSSMVFLRFSHFYFPSTILQPG